MTRESGNKETYCERITVLHKDPLKSRYSSRNTIRLTGNCFNIFLRYDIRRLSVTVATPIQSEANEMQKQIMVQSYRKDIQNVENGRIDDPQSEGDLSVQEAEKETTSKTHVSDDDDCVLNDDDNIHHQGLLLDIRKQVISICTLEEESDHLVPSHTVKRDVGRTDLDARNKVKNENQHDGEMDSMSPSFQQPPPLRDSTVVVQSLYL